ncbi:hypothetical protein PMG71_05985 [Roseofilum sp. BLCC_M154]|uniref:Uncharacterized protein n=1 Tax=Roseofilum acuticapitatum BLCC-M154 TaxID=3022444 RepID=A0ABT7APZ5_9CYAN|nr:hypothetical protein [Roseofilum acuticapitatum]MDJ1168970.1 hypothetical protein [Roseofilum acuticapitatum BLCC-M154]
MAFQTYYLIRSKNDGQYITAHLGDNQYILLFQQDFEAYSYLNTHAPDLTQKFAVETLVSSQLSALLNRWGYQGVGLVQDPLIPRVEFMARESFI